MSEEEIKRRIDGLKADLESVSARIDGVVTSRIDRLEMGLIRLNDDKFDADVYREAVSLQVKEHIYGRLLRILGFISFLLGFGALMGAGLWIESRMEAKLNSKLQIVAPSLSKAGEQVRMDRLEFLLERQDYQKNPAVSNPAIREDRYMPLLKEFIDSGSERRRILACAYAEANQPESLIDALFGVVNDSNIKGTIRLAAYRALSTYDDEEVGNRMIKCLGDELRENVSLGLADEFIQVLKGRFERGLVEEQLSQKLLEIIADPDISDERIHRAAFSSLSAHKEPKPLIARAARNLSAARSQLGHNPFGQVWEDAMVAIVAMDVRARDIEKTMMEQVPSPDDRITGSVEHFRRLDTATAIIWGTRYGSDRFSRHIIRMSEKKELKDNLWLRWADIYSALYASDGNPSEPLYNRAKKWFDDAIKQSKTAREKPALTRLIAHAAFHMTVAELSVGEKTFYADTDISNLWKDHVDDRLWKNEMNGVNTLRFIWASMERVDPGERRMQFRSLLEEAEMYQNIGFMTPAAIILKDLTEGRMQKFLEFMATDYFSPDIWQDKIRPMFPQFTPEVSSEDEILIQDQLAAWVERFQSFLHQDNERIYRLEEGFPPNWKEAVLMLMSTGQDLQPFADAIIGFFSFLNFQQESTPYYTPDVWRNRILPKFPESGIVADEDGISSEEKATFIAWLEENRWRLAYQADTKAYAIDPDGPATHTAYSIIALSGGNLLPFFKVMEEGYYEPGEWKDRVLPRFPEWPDHSPILFGNEGEQDELWEWVKSQHERQGLAFHSADRAFRLR